MWPPWSTAQVQIENLFLLCHTWSPPGDALQPPPSEHDCCCRSCLLLHVKLSIVIVVGKANERGVSGARENCCFPRDIHSLWKDLSLGIRSLLWHTQNLRRWKGSVKRKELAKNLLGDRLQKCTLRRKHNSSIVLFQQDQNIQVHGVEFYLQKLVVSVSQSCERILCFLGSLKLYQKSPRQMVPTYAFVVCTWCNCRERCA